MVANTPLTPQTHPGSEKCQVAIDMLQTKLRKVVEDFAEGRINRVQFHELYDRYHGQINRLMEFAADAGFLSVTGALGQEREDTLTIKKRLTARVIGISVYSNQTGMPIETIGDFAVDPALLVPMLSSYRDVTREIFKAGMRSTAMENNQWLCFVPGNFTTLIALFSLEPSTLQLEEMNAMHHDFEDANRVALERGNIDPLTLAYPFLTSVRKVRDQRRITGTVR